MNTNSLVSLEVSERIATVTLNRPQARNALSEQLCRELRAALESADQDEEVDVIMLTGADPAFCAGLDLREYRRLGRAPDGPSNPILSVGEIGKPGIAAVNAPAV